jgi:branched-chain amino acid transport system ATP-binding protein
MLDGLSIAGLHSYYGEAHVLQGVSLEVARRKVVALLGRNGMGKSTLIRSIMGLRPPAVHEGEILYRGESLRELSPHQIAQKRIGLVPQGRRLFASLTVIEHLTMVDRRPGAAWTVPRVLELFPRLADRRKHRGNQLSGGERQMLAIARALMLDPELLLLDEPSEGLAPVMVQQLEGILQQLKQTGLAILLVEQNLYSALAVSDEVYVLETGKIVVRGSPADLLRDRATMERFLGVK